MEALRRIAIVGGGRDRPALKPLAAMAPPRAAAQPFDPDAVKGYTEPMKMPRTVMTSTVPVDQLPSMGAGVALPQPDLSPRAPLQHKRVWVGFAVGVGVAVLAAAAVLALT